ncbi:MAG: endonuclease domain-containing protein [Proteobacteria bacterium]|nr:endonuclease domain-containing protein [Pseudomonadota bacterium]
MQDRTKPASEKRIVRARQLRRRQTEAEKRLWYHLRARRLGGHKFRRQHPVGPFVVDFYCEATRLVIEVDGGGHNEPCQRVYDQRRTMLLEGFGLRVLRFWNDEVLVNTEQVLEVILSALEDAPSAVAPSPVAPSPGLRPTSPVGRGAPEWGSTFVANREIPEKGSAPGRAPTTPRGGAS